MSVCDFILVHFTPSFEVNHVHIFGIFGLMGLMFVYRQFVLYSGEGEGAQGTQGEHGIMQGMAL